MSSVEFKSNEQKPELHPNNFEKRNIVYTLVQEICGTLVFIKQVEFREDNR